MSRALAELTPPRRTICFLEGGYDLDAITASVSATLAGAAGMVVPDEEHRFRSSELAFATLDAVNAEAAKVWTSADPSMVPERLNWLNSGISRELAEIFTAAGHDIHLVGGSVRDALLGRESTDLDFATSARPHQMKPLLGDWADQLFTVGERFGTIGLIRSGVRCEITTFRAETYRPESRHPEVIFGDSIEGDLGRRDFTVNAIALRLGLDTPSLVDPFNGVADLATRTLRTPVGPDVSFSDDPLRMVRLFRFMAQLGFYPDRPELEAVERLRERLQTISAERIRDEFSKLVVADGAAPAMSVMVESGLAAEFVPEVPALAMTEDPDHRHKDVLAHSLAVMAKTEPDLVLRLAALFHDVGKPATRKFEGPRVTFHHHEVVGARMTRPAWESCGTRTGQSTTWRNSCSSTCGPIPSRWVGPTRRYAATCGTRGSCCPGSTSWRGAMSPPVATAGPAGSSGKSMNWRSGSRCSAPRRSWTALRPPVDGHDVMEYLGIGPGPTVGAVLKVLLEKRIDHGPYDRAEAFGDVRAWAIEQGLPDPGEPPPEAAPGRS